MLANSRYGAHIALAIIIWIAFTKAAAAVQVPVIQPSDTLLGAGSTDIDEKTFVSVSEVGGLLVTERSSSGDWVATATLPVDEDFIARLAVHDGMVIAIGASAYSPPECYLYVFARRHGNWQRVQKLPYCGDKLALGARLAAVGDFQGVDRPSPVHVFRRNPDDTLELETTLSPVGTGDTFGEPRLAIADHTLLVGNPTANEGRGVVHVFDEVQGTWQESATLMANDPETTSFGRRVQAVGRVALIDAFDAPVDALTESYVFERVGQDWFEQSRLSATDPSVFASSPTLVDRHRVVVELRDEGGTTRYLARIGGSDGWTPIAQLGEVLPPMILLSTDATRGFVVSYEEGAGTFLYDVRGWQ